MLIKTFSGRPSRGAPIDLSRLIYRAGFFPHEFRIEGESTGPPLVLIDPKLFERRSLRIDDLERMCAAYRIPCLIRPTPEDT